MTLYIVIDGLGSFLLDETAPGTYRTEIDSGEFEWDKEYSYHFSTSPGGDPLPGWAGYSDSITMPKEPGEDGDWGWYWVAGCCILLVIIVIIALLLTLVLALRRREDVDWEE